MPDTIIEENRIVVEDESRTKVELLKQRHRVFQMTFSGFSYEGGRRTNVKKHIQRDQLLVIRDGILQLVESELFELYCHPENRAQVIGTPQLFTMGKFYLHCERSGRFEILVRNTIGLKRIMLGNPDLFFRELARALIESEEWFDGVHDDPVQRALMIMN